jgi:hypothetical protein
MGGHYSGNIREVFESQRHAVQEGKPGATAASADVGCVRGPGVEHGLVRRHRDEGAQRMVQLSDPREEVLRHLGCRELAGGQGLAQPGRAELVDVSQGSGPPSALPRQRYRPDRWKSR